MRIEVPEGLRPAGDEATDGGAAPDQLEQLCARLDQLGELLDARQTGRFWRTLIDRESKTSAPIGKTTLATTALAEFCRGYQTGSMLTDRAVLRRTPGALSSAGLQETGRSARLAAAQRAPAAGARDPAVARVVAPVDRPGTGGDDWQRALLGVDLAEYRRGSISSGTAAPGRALGGRSPARARCWDSCWCSARRVADKMPPLLKGRSARPIIAGNRRISPGSEPMEEALAAWLKETLQEAGHRQHRRTGRAGASASTPRSHTASTRGVEITEVRGWIVLRDNGKVYTKASVGVR